MKTVRSHFHFIQPAVWQPNTCAAGAIVCTAGGLALRTFRRAAHIVKRFGMDQPDSAGNRWRSL
jgi:hypothetical protein